MKYFLALMLMAPVCVNAGWFSNDDDSSSATAALIQKVREKNYKGAHDEEELKVQVQIETSEQRKAKGKLTNTDPTQD